MYLSSGLHDDVDAGHPTLDPARPADGQTADPVAVLREVLDRTDQQRSATSTLVEAGDLDRKLRAAVERYLDVHGLAEAASSYLTERVTSGGPLPGLPPPPTEDGELAEYTQRCADLVHALAARTGTDAAPGAAQLPDHDLVATHHRSSHLRHEQFLHALARRPDRARGVSR